MLKKLLWYLTTTDCEVCGERKPKNDINYFSMAVYEQVCEDCIKGW